MRFGRSRPRPSPPAIEAAPQAVLAPPVVAPVGRPSPDPGALSPALVETVAYAWRFLVLVAVAAVVAYAAAAVSLVTIAVAVALLVAALLSPINMLGRRAGLPAPAAAAAALLSGIGLIAAVGWLIYTRLTAEMDELRVGVVEGVESTVSWLETGPLGLDEINLSQVTAQVSDAVQANQSDLAGGAFAVASGLTNLFAGIALMLFVTFFVLFDGRRMWCWVVGLLPTKMRSRTDDAGGHAWRALVEYMRATVLVAMFDAAFIGAGLLLLGVPLAVPLTALVFLGAFIPLVGAFVAGALAVLVALATEGLTVALLVLGLNIVVQQVEGNVLQPLLLGRMVSIHPVAIVLGISAGSLIAGIPGAVLAVPILATVKAGASRLAELSTEGTPSSSPSNSGAA